MPPGVLSNQRPSCRATTRVWSFVLLAAPVRSFSGRELCRVINPHATRCTWRARHMNSP